MRRGILNERAGRRALGGIAALALLAAGGCGGGGGGDDGLEGALGKLDSEVDEELTFEWSDTARLRELANTGASSADLDISGETERYVSLLNIGWGPLAEQTAASFETVGFDPLGGDEAMTVGVGPEAVTRFEGVETEEAEPAFEKLGAEEVAADGETMLAVGEEGEFVRDAIDEFGVGLPVGVNRVVVEDDAIVLGGFEEPVAAAAGDPESTLADEPGPVAAASCLGEVIAASVVARDVALAPEDVEIVAVGLLDPGDSESLQEVLCAVGAEDADASELAEGLEGGLAPESVDPTTQQATSAAFDEVEVEEGEAEGLPYARAVATVPEGGRAGIFFQQLFTGQLGALLGSGPPLRAPTPDSAP